MPDAKKKRRESDIAGDEDDDEDEIEWDREYDNPDAKIILISNDNVGFRVDAWNFKKKSGFIRDLLDFPSTQLLDLAPIHLDVDSITLRAFVTYIFPYTDIPSMMTTDHCRDLFELCDRFDAPDIHNRVLLDIQKQLANHPDYQDLDVWHVFQLAAEQDKPSLATTAIRPPDQAGLTKQILFEPGRWSLDHLQDLPIRYLYALLISRHGRNTRGSITELDSAGIAALVAHCLRSL